MPPPEPNKKIEQLLQNYSRQRREEFGPGLELHPASRKVLLSEASHVAPQAAPKPKSFRSVMEWWRWFFVGAIAIWIVGLCFYIEMPPPRQALKPAEPVPVVASEHSRRVLKREEVVATADTPAGAVATAMPSPAMPSPAVPDAAKKLSNHISASDKTVSIPVRTDRSAVLAKNTPSAHAPVVQTAVGALGGASEGFSRNRDDSSRALAGVAPVQESRHFVRVANRGQYRESVQAPPLPKVLRSFELARTGKKLVITDIDGSVYEGEITKKTSSGYSFQVTGLSQYVHETVIFDGQFTDGGNDAAATVISGDVQVGSKDEFQLTAALSK